ncbi:CAD23-like protein [Mya arenaria]|uniref:CAD23-like protein n=1 Tax=Mya arenaria TaxID=6604 RepID=A0ABY7DGL4_MYAAR|nr:CAD23-like protein [Mya arenaria]
MPPHNFIPILVTLLAVWQRAFGNDSPQFLSSNQIYQIKEDKAIGSILFSLTATDSDGPQNLHFSIPTNHETNQIVGLRNERGNNTNGRIVDVVLKQKLDRDYTASPFKKLLFAVEDNPSGDGNYIQQGIDVFVVDVNDEDPKFEQNRYEFNINENSGDGFLVTTVKATDPDTGTILRYSMKPVGQAVSDDYRYSFKVDAVSGEVKVNTTLDANKYNYYEYKLYVNGALVIQVSALDGDKDVPNSVSYSFAGGYFANFNINSGTGEITVKNQLDRDSPAVKEKGGVYAINVKAVEDDESQPMAMRTATTLVTIKVDDVNDNTPTFYKSRYEAEILENMQEGVPVTFTSPAVMNTANSHFALTLEKDGKPYTDFSPLPLEVYAESSVLIRVQNMSALDYEKVQEITFQIVAREIGTTERLSSSATVVVKIKDMNDNTPQFVPETPTRKSVPEDFVQGNPILTLTATDLDTGENGKITYNIRGSNVFTINPTSGEITLNGPLDRETVSHYILTAEATDGGGRTAFTNLNITVQDVNDVKPTFLREEYYVTVREDSLTFLRGNLVVKAVDDDAPNTPNSQVKYQIIHASAGLQNKFSVNETSGEVTLVAKIDYEALPTELSGRVQLEIEAYDMGTPRLASSINVTVEIEDVNDNAPVFNQSVYTATILETVSAGTSVVQVFASDSDATPPSNQFLYRIDSGASDKFRINFQTGEITVETGAQLDRETKDLYLLNISATDRGAISQFGECIVEITIKDANDEPPRFVQENMQATIMENAALGEEVKCVSAVDPDGQHNLEFSLLIDSVVGFDEDERPVNVTGAGIQNYFKMVPSTGCIQVQSTLDREMVETVVLKVLVTDTLADTGSQTATGTVTVTLLDYNDNGPEFVPDDTYNVRISEGLELQSVVMRFETEDKDKQQTVTYQMESDPYNNFDITQSTGILQLKSKLDRETHEVFLVKVLAIDSGIPAITSTATVKENATAGTIVCRLSATDADLGEFGRVEYRFEVSNDDDNLKINKTSGEIYVARTLDREQRSSYTLYVRANDNPRDPDNQRTNQTVPIVILVDDINDNKPVFTNVEKTATVLENESPGRLVFTSSAEDPDDGVNSELKYTLAGPQEILNILTMTTIRRNISSIPKYFGEIRVAKSLIGLSGKHAMTVTVTDNGIMPLSTQTDLEITIEDVNIHPPVFVKPSGTNATITADESQNDETEPRSIFNFTASDADSGRNKEIYFEILRENDWQFFKLESCNFTGCELKNRRPLDRETHPTYLIKIKAEDNGVPKNYSTILTLTIVTLDINDELPEFLDDRSAPYRIQPHRIQIEEERVHDQTSTDLNIAVDKDAGNNSIICYYIIGGDPIVKEKFNLHTSGNLTLTAPIDRETLNVPYINFVIFATPRCFEKFDGYSRPEVYPPQNYAINRTTLWVQVEILDINDNPPVFKRSVLTIGVSRDTGYRTSITNLQDLVTDADATMSVEFHALRTEQYLQNSKLTTTKPFEVFKNGTVATNVFFQANMYGYFLIFVQAKENVTGGSPFYANATLRISLINDDQRLKVIIRQSPEAVRAFQVEFIQKLTTATGYRIVVDKIQVHDTGNTEGNVNQNMTDMFIHGEDMKTNETISAVELRRTIDSLADELYQFKYFYKVAEIVLTTSEVEEKSLENTFKMALILVTVILALLCVAICIIFYISRRQYKRKLKAATALAYGSNSDLHKLELPGTNVHAYENANPIYIEKVLLEEAGEHNDDDDSLDNNAIESTSPSATSEQHMSMNFYTEDNDLNKVPQSKLGNGDAILNAALLQHQKAKLKNGTAGNENGTAVYANGRLESKADNFEGLPTTEI